MLFCGKKIRNEHNLKTYFQILYIQTISQERKTKPLTLYPNIASLIKITVILKQNPNRIWILNLAIVSKIRYEYHETSLHNDNCKYV